MTPEDGLTGMPLPGGMRLDDILPIYDFHEVHSTVIHGTPGQIFDAIKLVAPEEILFFGFLMGMRRLPGWLVGRRGGRVEPRRPLLAQFVDEGFAILAEAAERELVVGGIAQFWKPWEGKLFKITTPEEFKAFRLPGYAKVAVNFFISADLTGGVRLRTETRILASDPLAQRKFTRYWRLIHPGSAFIRKMWLRAIKRRVER